MAKREYRNRIGYDLTSAGPADVADALARWEENVRRAGLRQVTPHVMLSVERVTSPGLESIGQYALEVIGEVDDGDQ